MSNYLIGTFALLVFGTILVVCYLVDKRDEQKAVKIHLDKLNEKEKSRKEENKQVKPRISPPVHSMLELMMKQPEGFEYRYEYGLDIYEHRLSGINFSFLRSHQGTRCYTINHLFISGQEGNYLYEYGVSVIKSYIEEKRQLREKEKRASIDRNITKVLEGV